jgi:hypothetical protein
MQGGGGQSGLCCGNLRPAAVQEPAARREQGGRQGEAPASWATHAPTAAMVHQGLLCFITSTNTCGGGRGGGGRGQQAVPPLSKPPTCTCSAAMHACMPHTTGDKSALHIRAAAAPGSIPATHPLSRPVGQAAHVDAHGGVVVGRRGGHVARLALVACGWWEGLAAAHRLAGGSGRRPAQALSGWVPVTSCVHARTRMQPASQPAGRSPPTCPALAAPGEAGAVLALHAAGVLARRDAVQGVRGGAVGHAAVGAKDVADVAQAAGAAGGARPVAVALAVRGAGGALEAGVAGADAEVQAVAGPGAVERALEQLARVAREVGVAGAAPVAVVADDVRGDVAGALRASSRGTGAQRGPSAAGNMGHRSASRPARQPGSQAARAQARTWSKVHL